MDSTLRWCSESSGSGATPRTQIGVSAITIGKQTSSAGEPSCRPPSPTACRAARSRSAAGVSPTLTSGSHCPFARVITHTRRLGSSSGMCEPAAARRVEVREPRQRVAERHQARHLVGPLRRLAAGLRRVLGLERQLAPAIELIEEDQRHDDDRRRRLQVEALVQPADADERPPAVEWHAAREGNACGEKRAAIRENCTVASSFRLIGHLPLSL